MLISKTPLFLMIKTYSHLKYAINLLLSAIFEVVSIRSDHLSLHFFFASFSISCYIEKGQFKRISADKEKAIIYLIPLIMARRGFRETTVISVY